MADWLNTESDLTPWETRGSSQEHLSELVEKVYWEGLRREIASAILSLKRLDNEKTLPEEEEIMLRMPDRAAYYAAAWSPFKLDDNQDAFDNVWEYAAAHMAERQNKSVKYRRARMLLAGLAVFDISTIVEYREPILRSQMGKVQVNVSQVPNASSASSIWVQSLLCCECRRPIRSIFYRCTQHCVHHDPESNTGCATIKHEFNVCAVCLATTSHVRSHLKKTRPYEPCLDHLNPPLTDAQQTAMRNDIQKLQRHEDTREDQQDGKRALRMALHLAPETVKSWLLPYGNVHSMVMFGPLLFEIGNTRGLLITLRRPLNATLSVFELNKTPAIAISPNREISTRVRISRERKIHAVEKQVIGGLFSGHLLDWAEVEDELILKLISESEAYQERPTKNLAYNRKMLEQASERIIEIFKTNLYPEVQSYLGHFTSKIFDRQTNLSWNQFTNNCQDFCNALMGGKAFAATLTAVCPSSIRGGTQPRYLLSFLADTIGSIWDSSKFLTTPSGAYFREFHIDEDEIEYFQTWPTIPLDKSCAKILCWPCINGNCTIKNHIWLMPSESASILQLHLIRGRLNYERYKTMDPFEEITPMSDGEWLQNRLSILLAHEIFLSSAGALSQAFQVQWEDQPQDTRQWLPGKANTEGHAILEPTQEGDANFTIEVKAGFAWRKRDRTLRKWLSKTGISKARQSDIFAQISKQDDEIRSAPNVRALVLSGMKPVIT